MGVTKQNQLDYIKGYNKENYVVVRVQFNKKTESDILTHLNSQPNKSRYVKNLVIEDMKK